MPTTEPKRSSGARNIKRYALLVFVIVAAVIAFDRMGACAQNDGQNGGKKEEYRKTTRDDCSYLQSPDTFRSAMANHPALESPSPGMVLQSIISAIDERTEISLVSPQDIPRKNFIDDILFDRMSRDNVISAPIATDDEFVRRVYLDITGRIPSAADVTAFLADTAANKRDALVDRLVGSPEYVDKWTMFFSDLFKVTARSTNVVRYSGGRDAFYNYIKNSVAANKSYAQMATEMITSGSAAAADNFINGEANFIVGGIIPMGPLQDTMDGSAVNTAGQFLGVKSLDLPRFFNRAGDSVSGHLSCYAAPACRSLGDVGLLRPSPAPAAGSVAAAQLRQIHSLRAEHRRISAQHQLRQSSAARADGRRQRGSTELHLGRRRSQSRRESSSGDGAPRHIRHSIRPRGGQLRLGEDDGRSSGLAVEHFRSGAARPGGATPSGLVAATGQRRIAESSGR